MSSKRKRILVKLGKAKAPAKKAQKTTRTYTMTRLPNTSRAPELKCLDTFNTNYPLDVTNVNPSLLNGIKEGAAFYERIGRRIEMKSLQITGYLSPIPARSQDVTLMGRILIIYDSQANGTTPVWSTVIKNYKWDGTTESAYNSLINLDNRNRFEMIRDYKFVLPSVTRDVTPKDTFVQGTSVHCTKQAQEFIIDDYIKLKRRVTQYSASTADAGAVSTGALWIYAYGIGVAAWEAQISTRLRYYDN